MEYLNSGFAGQRVRDWNPGLGTSISEMGISF